MAQPGSGPAPAVSISYAAPLVAVAWSWTGAVGVDLEHDGPPVGGVGRVEWTQREAWFKAGAGAQIAVRIAAPDGYVGTVVGPDGRDGADVTWRVVGPAARSG